MCHLYPLAISIVGSWIAGALSAEPTTWHDSLPLRIRLHASCVNARWASELGSRLLCVSVWILLLFVCSASPHGSGPPVTDEFNSSTLNTTLWTFVNGVNNGRYSLSGSDLLLTVPAGSNHD